MTTSSISEKTPTDLEIRIFQRQARPGPAKGGEGYPVEITLGEQQEFPRGYLAADIVPWAPTGVPEDDGQKLFETLFADGDLRAAWAEAQGQAPQRRIRLRIDANAAELHALPWELLQQDRLMLSAQADTPFSRYLPIALPWSGPVDERPIRVLVVISDPDDLQTRYDLPPVDVALERESLESALQGVKPGDLHVDFLDAPVTAERLEHALRGTSGQALRDDYHVLHFVGHGAFSARRAKAALYLQDDEGNAQRVLDDALVSMVARQGARPRLVLLMACQSASRSTSDAFVGLGPKLVAVGVPAVIAMQDVVTIETAHKFSAAFYPQLLEHGQVDLAVNEARSTLLTAGRTDAAVPVLFMRLKSGQLWGDEANVRGQVLGARNPRIFWSGLIKMIKLGKCIPIIGPGVRGQLTASAREIARAWIAEHEYPFSDQDHPAMVAQYMASSMGQDFPRYELLDALKQSFRERLPDKLRPDESYETLTELAQAVEWEELVGGNPNEVHQVLASLNLPLYLTNNYDGFLTQALAAQGKEPVREICPWNDMLDGLPSSFEDDPDYEPTAQKPLVYHLFGSDQEVDSLVLTVDDHLDFLVHTSSEMERIPNHIWAALTNSTLMFVGFRLRDMGFRVILRGLVATRHRRRRVRHVGVQLEPGGINEDNVEAARSYLQQYFQEAEINVFSGSMQQFMAELREEWEAAN